ncbi:MULTISPECIES: hypothetical protein [unclassified Butyrivibrio]|uniref:hypothetical protein n=1 Tax=unclassified Butyrivibrio TaxID=2639466 RepID=UPI0004193E72|nr:MULTISPECIES: hypothetical protein [unclassified Butyrivibrio]
MNQSLYNAVFCVGEQKIDPFAAAKIDFERVIGDMRLGGYEITSLNVAEFIVLHWLDDMRKKKNDIIDATSGVDNRDAYCLEKFGISFKDIDALEPTTDIEWDLKSGQVLLFLGSEVQYKEDAYMKMFGEDLQKFCQDTGFIYTKLGEAI